MSVYKRGRVYYLDANIPGIGVVRTSTRGKDKRLANDMHSALFMLAKSGWADLVAEVRDGHLSLMELWQAHLEGDVAMTRLRERRNNPLLADYIADRLPLVTDERVALGYRQLRDTVDSVEARVAREEGRRAEPVRVSWVIEPTHLTALYEQACVGRKPNSVRRSLHRAVADLITRKYSRGKMLAVMADAIVPGEKDERPNKLTPDEINRLLEACDVEFRAVVGLAITTGIDRKPMLALRVHHWNPDTGILTVPDLKNNSRPRDLLLRGTPVLENAEPWLMQLAAGRKPEEPLVRYSPRNLRDYWEAAREAIGRRDIRWKDLRGMFATYSLTAGNEPRDVQYIMGHSTAAMTVRYMRRLPAGSQAARDAMRAEAARVGVYRPDLRVVSTA